jgi:mevalonyl-CoA ligase
MTVEDRQKQIESPSRAAIELSTLQGPLEPPLLDIHLGQLLENQAQKFGPKTAIVCSKTNQRLTYDELKQRTEVVSKGLLARGIQRGDVVGILAGNCVEYVELFFAVGRIGAMLALFNNTYTSDELCRALSHTGNIDILLRTEDL